MQDHENKCGKEEEVPLLDEQLADTPKLPY